MLREKMKVIQKVQAVGLTENSMFFLSWLTALGSGTGSVCLMTDTDSPEEKMYKNIVQD